MPAADVDAGLPAIGAGVQWPDHDAESAAAERLTNRRLGRLVELGAWLAGARGGAGPSDLTDVRCLDFAAATTPAERGVDTLLLLGITRRAVGSGSEPEAGPLTLQRVRDAIASGAAAADAEVDSGAELFIAVVGGDDVLTASAAIVAVATNTEPVKVISRGVDATDPDAWMARVVAVRDARRLGMAHRGDPDRLVATIGTAELAAAAGFVLQSAVRRTPVLLDGLAAIAAALLAYEAQPRAVRWWRVADAAPGPAHEFATAKLGMHPVLDLGIGVADGTAGALAVPVLRSAVRALIAEQA